jgi:hypothetical protein
MNVASTVTFVMFNDNFFPSSLAGLVEFAAAVEVDAEADGRAGAGGTGVPDLLGSALTVRSFP